MQNSLGSGVIVSADGYILTNNHVVVGESQRMALQGLDVSVSLGDKREMPARVVGVDPATDLALLKVEATNLPTMPWGDSSKLRVAEWVLAIGNPYQLSQTVTLGIVSAVGRTNLGRLGVRGLRADRRGDQPGQLRRRARERTRRTRGHQHGDLQPERRIPGHRLRRVEQPRPSASWRT